MISPEMQAEMMTYQAQSETMWNRFFEYSQQQMEIQQAQTEGAFWSQMALHEAEQAAESSMRFAVNWQKSFNQQTENAQAVALGLESPHNNTNMGGSFDERDSDNWSTIGDIFGNHGSYNSPADAVDMAKKSANEAKELAES